jgi:hypothetical protein
MPVLYLGLSRIQASKRSNVHAPSGGERLPASGTATVGAAAHPLIGIMRVIRVKVIMMLVPDRGG